MYDVGRLMATRETAYILAILAPRMKSVVVAGGGGGWRGMVLWLFSGKYETFQTAYFSVAVVGMKCLTSFSCPVLPKDASYGQGGLCHNFMELKL